VDDKHLLDDPSVLLVLLWQVNWPQQQQLQPFDDSVCLSGFDAGSSQTPASSTIHSSFSMPVKHCAGPLPALPTDPEESI